MRGFWTESKWYLDDGCSVMPNGHRLSLRDILQWQADVIEGRFDLTRAWSGWRVRRQVLIAPGGTMRRGVISEHVMRHLVSNHDHYRTEVSRRQLQLFDSKSGLARGE